MNTPRIMGVGCGDLLGGFGDAPLDPQELDFARECAHRGICPRCLNIGERDDQNIDMFGICNSCGYELRRNVEAASPND